MAGLKLAPPETLKLAGLNNRDAQVIANCYWARTQVENGHFLLSDGFHKAADRMIERGFVTEVSPREAGVSPPFSGGGFRVVKLTQENWNKVRAALADGSPSTTKDGDA